MLLSPEIVVPLAGIGMIISLALGVPLVRSYTRRMETRARDPLPSGDLTARLDRIEQGIEAMSTEVERIAEGQRFTTKLLSADTRPAAELQPANAPAHVAVGAPRTGATPADGTTLSPAARR